METAVSAVRPPINRSIRFASASSIGFPNPSVDDDGVCGEHGLVTVVFVNGARFFREARDVVGRRFTGTNRFVDIRRPDVEIDPGGAEQLGAPGRGRREDDSIEWTRGHRDDCRIVRDPRSDDPSRRPGRNCPQAPLTEEKVGFAWRTAVGAAVAGATEIALDGTTLRVRARDRAWQREIERSVATIRTRLDDLLGAGVVRYLDVTAAAAEEPRRPVVLDARRRLRLRGRLNSAVGRWIR